MMHRCGRSSGGLIGDIATAAHESNGTPAFIAQSAARGAITKTAETPSERNVVVDWLRAAAAG